jgi:lipase maturation factor 1
MTTDLRRRTGSMLQAPPPPPQQQQPQTQTRASLRNDNTERRPLLQHPSSENADDEEEDHSTDLRTTPCNSANIPVEVVSYKVAKWAILRSTAGVYFVAFLGAYYQNIGLMGSQGLQPAARDYWNPLVEQQHAIYDDDSHGWWEMWWRHGFFQHPSLYWWIPVTDATMTYLAVAGITISGMVCFLQQDSMLLLLLLWLLDFSIVTLAQGTSFYAYGWESQLLETGFLAIFLCDTLLLPSNNCSIRYASRRHRPFNDRTNETYPEPSQPAQHGHLPSSDSIHLILYLYQWLCFRISMGAGLIKIRGDSCWTQKTCLLYHFETQPIPSPTSFIFHFLPPWMLRQAVNLDLFVQVYTSWMVLLCPILLHRLFLGPRLLGQQQQQQPRRLSKFLVGRVLPTVYQVSLWFLRVGGVIQGGFMVNIVLSGNFSFLNHLTIIPALACLDDACWPRALRDHVMRQTGSGTTFSSPPPPSSMAEATRSSSHSSSWSWWARIRTACRLIVVCRIAYLSRPVIANLMQWEGRRQQMNASYDRFRLVNTYGAFGSVGQGRYEPIVSITYNYRDWYELEFPCKPGSVDRRPCFCAPYHYRIDWNIWFIGFKPHANMLHGRETWMFRLVTKLLTKPETTTSTGEDPRPWLNLLDATSSKMLRYHYDHKYQTPVAVKVEMYHYQMTAPLWESIAQYLQRQWIPWLWTRLLLLQEQERDLPRHEPATTASASSSIVWWKRNLEEVLIPPVTWDPVEDRLVRVQLR